MLLDLKERVGKIEVLLLSCAAITGVIHLYIGLTQSYHTLSWAGAGFLGGAVIFLSGYFRNLVVAASIPYTLVQFVFYYQSYGLNFWPLAAFDKIVQVVFVVSGVFYLSRKYTESEDIWDFVRHGRGKGI
jgi:hypothetical protein